MSLLFVVLTQLPDCKTYQIQPNIGCEQLIFLVLLKHWCRGERGLFIHIYIYSLNKVQPCQTIYNMLQLVLTIQKDPQNVCHYICVQLTVLQTYKIIHEKEIVSQMFHNRGKVYMRGQQHPCLANPVIIKDYIFV